jgi:hypothetical protein
VYRCKITSQRPKKKFEALAEMVVPYFEKRIPPRIDTPPRTDSNPGSNTLAPQAGHTQLPYPFGWDAAPFQYYTAPQSPHQQPRSASSPPMKGPFGWGGMPCPPRGVGEWVAPTKMWATAKNPTRAPGNQGSDAQIWLSIREGR